ncbi:MAG: hypothetical protein FWD75_03275 [Propionibacteriaceae bacterium]|nr:hypothetical protein [Propionibacteriaceae bacterium]
MTQTTKRTTTTDLDDIRDLLPVATTMLGTRTPGTRPTRHTPPQPQPPIPLESLTLANTTITPTPRPITTLDPHDDTPGTILNAWWAHITHHLTTTQTTLLSSEHEHRSDTTGTTHLACLLAANHHAYHTSNDPNYPTFAHDMRTLANRLRTLTGEHNPHPATCPACGNHDLRADSPTSRHVTCHTCGWARTAPILATLPEIASLYQRLDTDDWTPALSTLRHWATTHKIQRHTGLLSPTGEDLYRLEHIHQIVRQKALNGWKNHTTTTKTNQPD